MPFSPAICGANPSTTASAPKRSEPVTLNFNNAEIEAVARTMATLTGRNVVVDPRVKGTLTLNTEGAVSPAAAFQQFVAALRLMGFAVVQTEGLDKVVPEADAKLHSGGVAAIDGGSTSTPAGNQLVTQIIRLQFENANNLVTVLRPLISPNNPINVNPGNNSLVITDYADNLKRVARIVAALDVPNATDLEIIPLKNAIASDLAPLVQRLLETGGSVRGTPAAGSVDTGSQNHAHGGATLQQHHPAGLQPGATGFGQVPHRQARPAQQHMQPTVRPAICTWCT